MFLGFILGTISYLSLMLNEPLSWTGPIYSFCGVRKSWRNLPYLLPRPTHRPLVHPNRSPSLIILVCMLPFSPFKSSKRPSELIFKLNIPRFVTFSRSGMMSSMGWLPSKINTSKTFRVCLETWWDWHISHPHPPFLPPPFLILLFLPHCFLCLCIEDNALSKDGGLMCEYEYVMWMCE